jgi:hypothetical protein
MQNNLENMSNLLLVYENRKKKTKQCKETKRKQEIEREHGGITVVRLDGLHPQRKALDGYIFLI